MKKERECPFCNRVLLKGSGHVKICSKNDLDYKYKYIIHNFPKLDKETIHKLYNEDKWSLSMIKDKYGLDFKNIEYLILYYGYECRTIKQSHALREYKDRIESTNLKKFGAVNPLSRGTIPYHNRNKTVIDRYGCDNVFQVLGKFIDISKPHRCKSSISSLNRKLYNILNDLNVEFIPEYSLKYIDKDGKKRWKLFDAKVGNILIEANGNYWHANPNKYSENNVFNFPKSTTTAKQIWKDDLIKKELAEANGFTMLYIWESEFNKNINNVKEKIKNSINTKC
jgi:hypothetical protein